MGHMKLTASLCLAISFFHASHAHAQAFTRVITFGDSLSDVGNVASQTFGISPGSSYYNNRYSNGPLWIDSLSSKLNLGASVNSRASGYNYATGGTRSGTGYVTPVVFVNLPNAGQQLTDYLASRTPGADELITIWTGGNDFLDGQTDPNVPANNVQTLLNRLATAGAKNISVSNLPPLGETPRYNTTVNRATMNTRSAQFNAALSSRLDTFAAANPSISLFRIDVSGFFSSVLANPSAYGFTNVTDRALNGSTVVPNPDQYAFYDDVHPTRVAHGMLGTLAFETVTTRRFVGASSTADNWATAANWAVSRVPDSLSSVYFDNKNARLSSQRIVRRAEIPTGGGVRFDVGASGGGKLTASEQANLTGEIALGFATGFVGLPGQSFTLINSAAVSGSPILSNQTGYAGLDLIPVKTTTSFAIQLSATAGDANLDDFVNFDDLLIISQHYAEASTQTWLTGDFNGDTSVGFADLLLLAQNYNPPAISMGGDLSRLNHSFAADFALARSLVPEPATGLAAMLMLGTCRRRR